MFPVIVVSSILYLAAPFSIHPNWVYVPAALIFGYSTWLTAATFKKHL
jgi:hypothetical protein